MNHIICDHSLGTSNLPSLIFVVVFSSPDPSRVARKALNNPFGDKIATGSFDRIARVCLGKRSRGEWMVQDWGVDSHQD